MLIEEMKKHEKKTSKMRKKKEFKEKWKSLLIKKEREWILESKFIKSVKRERRKIEKKSKRNIEKNQKKKC